MPTREKSQTSQSAAAAAADHHLQVALLIGKTNLDKQSTPALHFTSLRLPYEVARAWNRRNGARKLLRARSRSRALRLQTIDNSLIILDVGPPTKS